MPVRRGTLEALFSDSTFIDLYSCQTLTLKRKHSFLMFSMRLFSIWPSMACYGQRLFFTALKHQSQKCIQLHVSAFSQLRLTGNILELDCLLCVGTSFLTCKNNGWMQLAHLCNIYYYINIILITAMIRIRLCLCLSCIRQTEWCWS